MNGRRIRAVSSVASSPINGGIACVSTTCAAGTHHDEGFWTMPIAVVHAKKSGATPELRRAGNYQNRGFFFALARRSRFWPEYKRR